MAKILDGIKMSNPVLSGNTPGAEGDVASIEEARNAVIGFLSKMPDAKQVSVTKVVLIDLQEGTWEAEAEAWMPNATVKALGLPVQREVLDCKEYLLRLDRQLNIVAYGLRDLVEQREM